MDWMSLSVEAMGIVILCIWVVVPIGEFKSIFASLRQKDTAARDKDGGLAQ